VPRPAINLIATHSLCCPADCTGYDIIIVNDYGNGTSLCEGVRLGSRERVSDVNCVTPFFSKTCSVFSGIIEIVISNAQGLDAEAYVEPNIDTWLNNIGLGSLTALLQNVQVYADHTPYPLPRPIAPVFLTSLQQAGNIFVNECEDCFSDSNYPPVNASMLTALPGLQHVVQLNGFANLTFLTVHTTAFQDLTSFSGLACVTATATKLVLMTIIGNIAMKSFNGLEAMQPVSIGLNLDATGSGPFSTADSVAGLRSLAGCTSGSGPASGGYVLIPTGCVPDITSFAEMCTYQGVTCR
jgi:hypothetical protein